MRKKTPQMMWRLTLGGKGELPMWITVYVIFGRNGQSSFGLITSTIRFDGPLSICELSWTTMTMGGRCVISSLLKFSLGVLFSFGIVTSPIWTI